MDEGRPVAPAVGRGCGECLVGGDRVEERIAASEPVGGEAAPAVVAGGFDQVGAEGIGLDVAEDRQEVVVVLDDGALELALLAHVWGPST